MCLVNERATSPAPYDPAIFDKGGLAERKVHFRAWGIVGKSGFRRDDLDDLKQDLFCELITRLPKFDAGRGALSTFVGMVLRNRAADILRTGRRGFYEGRTGEDNLEEQPHARDSQDGALPRRDRKPAPPIEALGAEDDRRRTVSRTDQQHSDMCCDLEQTLDRLPPGHRQVCEDLKTLTVTEAARARGVRPRAFHRKHVLKLRPAFERAGLGGYVDAARAG